MESGSKYRHRHRRRAGADRPGDPRGEHGFGGRDRHPAPRPGRTRQDRKLRPADIAGATFTLSNLGMYNVDAFLAIVNTPQAAILAVGRIADRVVPVNGQAAVKPMLTLSLSCDHRVVGRRPRRTVPR